MSQQLQRLASQVGGVVDRLRLYSCRANVCGRRSDQAAVECVVLVWCSLVTQRREGELT